MVCVYGSAVPGSVSWPNAWVSVKLPIGVAVDDSLGCALIPALPSQAATGGPTGCQPPLLRCQARRVAVVLPVEVAATVITCVASAVAKRSGNAWDEAAERLADAVARCTVLDGAGVRAARVGVVDVGDVRGAAEDVSTGDGVGGAEVVVAAAGTEGVRDELELAGSALPEQAASTDAMTSAAANRAPVRLQLIRSACHAVPIRMRGCADGVSHRMRLTRVVCGIATQPAVGAPSVTWRKNADPCGQAELPEGVLMTTA